MNRKAIVLGLCLALLWWLPASPAGAKGTYFTLTVTVQGSGTITTNPVFATYPTNVTVTLTAAPSTGWYFSGWSGDASGSGNPLNVTMTGNLSITGSFLAYPTYSLTLSTNGQGAVNLSPAGGSYDSNTVVTATAVPAAGWMFTGWSGGTNSSANPLTITLDASLALTANYAQLPAITRQPLGHTNAAGSTVSLSATAVGTAPLAYQWYFANGSLSGATNATLTLTNATTSQSGFYDLVVTNLYGSATSSVVSLVLTNASEFPTVVCDEAGLQAAISAGGWISIGCSGTITLTNTLTITNQVVLDGSSVSATISGGNLVRLFFIAPGASLAVTNLTLANGNQTVTTEAGVADGGAVYNNGGTLTLTACMLTNNATSGSTTGRGGAIFNNGGTVQIYGSAGIDNSVSGQCGYGGFLFNTNGTVIILNDLLQSNQCYSIGEGFSYGEAILALGGAVFQASGSLFATNTTLAGNQTSAAVSDPDRPASPVYGGALAALGGTVSLDLCQFLGNTAAGGNGDGDSTAAPAFGGALYCSNFCSAVSCSFSGNQALAGNYSYDYGGPSTAPTGSGGAIYNVGTLILGNCLVSSNVTLGGYPSAYAVDQGGNAAGGGIFNAGNILATNSTIALNSAIGSRGNTGTFSGGSTAPNGSALGGGLFNSTNASFLGLNVTIASNNCNGLAAGVQIANTNGTVQLRNSLLAYGGTNGNAYGVITDLGDNISSDGTANFESGSSYNFTDPLLGPLANNGGPTLTMALLPDSPAIAFANSSTAPPDDQRSFARPTGVEVIDLGAYQSGATQLYYPPPFLYVADAYPNVVVSFTTSPLITNTLHFQVSTNLSVWTDLATFGALASPSNIFQTIPQHGAPRQYFRLTW